MQDFSNYNLREMAADPQRRKAVRQAARDKLEIGDEDEYYRLKMLAEKLDEIAKREGWG